MVLKKKRISTVVPLKDKLGKVIRLPKGYSQKGSSERFKRDGGNQNLLHDMSRFLPEKIWAPLALGRKPAKTTYLFEDRYTMNGKMG